MALEAAQVKKTRWDVLTLNNLATRKAQLGFRSSSKGTAPG